jgi:N-acetylglucosamine kinase-like BadF-type ATPase
MKYIIGVDAGGTKTEAVAYNLQGDELFRANTGYGSMVLDKSIALNNLVKSVEMCIEKLDGEKPLAVYFGIAGVEAGNNKALVKEATLKKVNTFVKVLNDAEIALEALLQGDDGILTIGGTGSISLGRCKGNRAMAGGWGHLLGEAGGGYYIAIEAFKNMILEEDSNFEKSMLTKRLLKELNIQEVQKIKGFIYSSTKSEIAALAPVVVEMANNGEEKAVEILKRTGQELAIITEKVYKKLNFEGSVKIALKGSIAIKIKTVRQEFENYLKESIGNIIIIDEDVSSAKGAYYLAMKDLDVH